MRPDADANPPGSVVQRQLDAYNARDLEAFLATFDADVRLFRPPAVEPVLVGKEALGRFYAAERFNHAGLRAELLHRITVGRTVIDHERIHGVRAAAFEVAVAYDVVDGRIHRVWTYAAE